MGRPSAALGVSVFAGVAVLLVLVIGLALCVGAVWVPLDETLRILLTKVSPGLLSASPANHEHIIWAYRTPRVLLAALVGGGLAVAGVVIQTAVRNPLADPYILGVSSGASLGAVLLLFFKAEVFGGAGLFIASFTGGASATLLVYLLARQQNALSPQRLVLAGVATTYLLSSATSFLLVQVDRQGFGGSSNFLYWSLGSLARARWDALGIPVVTVALCLAWLLLQGRTLDCLILGDESATALGARPQRMRFWLFGMSSLLVGACVAAAGPIGFVGLMIPHAARQIVGPSHRPLLCFSALLGAVFLVSADALARTVHSPHEIPVGILTAMCGAPFFLLLLRRLRGAYSP